jgi:hypothetical protein
MAGYGHLKRLAKEPDTSRSKAWYPKPYINRLILVIMKQQHQKKKKNETMVIQQETNKNSLKIHLHCINVSTIFKKQLHHIMMSRICCMKQCSPSFRVTSIYFSTLLFKKTHIYHKIVKSKSPSAMNAPKKSRQQI